MSKTGTYSADTVRVLEMIGQKPIAYHPAFARRLGVKAAILLGQLLYWHGKQSNPDGWIRKTAQEMDDETALNEREQETARAALINAGCVEYKRMGMPAMPHYRVLHNAILDCMLSDHVRTKRPNKTGQNVLTCEDNSRGVMLGQNVLTYTETTAETTAETTNREEDGADAPRASAPKIVVPDSLKNQPAPPRKPRILKHAETNITESDDIRILTYLEFLSRDITISNGALILQRVSDDKESIAAWRDVCIRWVTSEWNPTNFSGMFDAYDRAMNAKRVQAKHGTPKARGRTEQPQQFGVGGEWYQAAERLGWDLTELNAQPQEATDGN